MFVDGIAKIGAECLNKMQSLGRSCRMMFDTLGCRHLRNQQFFPLLIQQIYSIGVLSLVIIVVAGFFIGMVLGLQGYNVLVRFGAENSLGQLVTLSLVRELGPVVTALLFAGRAGSALTAEIGSMKVTEQLASMEMIGVDPLKRIVAPRFWAGFVSMPILSCVFCVVGVYGSSVVGVKWLNVYEGSFWVYMQNSVDFMLDVMNGIIKSVVFGIVITWIAVFEGYDAVATSEGVSRATTKTVVYSSLAVLGLDFILTSVMFGSH